MGTFPRCPSSDKRRDGDRDCTRRPDLQTPARMDCRYPCAMHPELSHPVRIAFSVDAPVGAWDGIVQLDRLFEGEHIPDDSTVLL